MGKTPEKDDFEGPFRTWVELFACRNEGMGRAGSLYAAMPVNSSIVSLDCILTKALEEASLVHPCFSWGLREAGRYCGLWAVSTIGCLGE